MQGAPTHTSCRSSNPIPRATLVLFNGGYPFTFQWTALARTVPNAYADPCWWHMTSPRSGLPGSTRCSTQLLRARLSTPAVTTMSSNTRRLCEGCTARRGAPSATKSGPRSRERRTPLPRSARASSTMSPPCAGRTHDAAWKQPCGSPAGRAGTSAPRRRACGMTPCRSVHPLGCGFRDSLGDDRMSLSALTNR